MAVGISLRMVIYALLRDELIEFVEKISFNVGIGILVYSDTTGSMKASDRADAAGN